MAARFIANQVDDARAEVSGAPPGIERRDICGEERRGDATLPQRPQIRLSLRVVSIEVHVVAEQTVRRIAMTVDDDGAAMNSGTLIRCGRHPGRKIVPPCQTRTPRRSSRA